MTQIAIVDYGMGNIRSVEQALRKVCDGQDIITTNDPASIDNADKLVFPGQGAAGSCMQAINQQGLAEVLIRAAKQKPFLGICMGLQVLMQHSEESEGTDCLGVFEGEVRYLGERIGKKPGHKIPHMGWNRVQQSKSHPLWQSIDDESFFYFVHSYHTCAAEAKDIAATSEYGETFTCALARDFVFAVQFHPEKSADVGLNLLANFVVWDGSL